MKVNETAFCKWMVMTFNGDVDQIAAYLFHLLACKAAPSSSEVWKLIEATGDEKYTSDTFKKAALIVLGKLEPVCAEEEAV